MIKEAIIWNHHKEWTLQEVPEDANGIFKVEIPNLPGQHDNVADVTNTDTLIDETGA